MAPSDTFRPSSLSEHPDLTPEEVGRRFLRLLDDLESTEALTAEAVASKTGLPLKYAPLGKVHAFIVNLPNSPWYYGVTYNDRKQRKAVELEYTHEGDALPAGAPLCGLELDTVAAELKAEGFVLRIDVDEIGQPLEYIFRRARLSVRAVVGPSVAIKEAKSRACIAQLMITTVTD